LQDRELLCVRLIGSYHSLVKLRQRVRFIIPKAVSRFACHRSPRHAAKSLDPIGELAISPFALLPPVHPPCMWQVSFGSISLHAR
jgi:hypothetical protein